MSSMLSLNAGHDRLDQIFENMQRGLVYPSPYACFVTYWRNPEDIHGDMITKDALTNLKKEVRAEIHDHYGSKNTTAVMGVNFSLWKKWCKEEGVNPPANMNFKFPETGKSNSCDSTPACDESSTVFSRSSSFVDSKGDLWFHIKSDNLDHVRHVKAFIHSYLTEKLKIVSINCTMQEVSTKSTQSDMSDGKVLGRRFSENLNNPTDPINLAHHSLIGYEDVENMGGSFALAQRFNINWAQIHGMTDRQIEDIIGRKTGGNIIPFEDERHHIKCGRVRNDWGNTRYVLRLGLPFGTSPYVDDPKLAHKGSNVGDEKGLYFAGFVNDVKILESIMDQMIGETPEFMRDHLFNKLKSDHGGLYYIPSCKNLNLPPNEWAQKEFRNWSIFPGIAWDRLDRFFNKRSPNGLMFYNHKDYLYTMATAGVEEQMKLNPPSYRILILLADVFTLWQDNWYFNRKQEEIGHLKEYIAKEYGADKAKEVMELSIMERKGWATKMSLRLFSSDEYGCRGQRDVSGKTITGANTFHIHPHEIIVGGMPNLSLGQGRYVMKYLSEEESIVGYLNGLSEASGVGHVVPGHEQTLIHGIPGLIKKAEAQLRNTDNENKRSFYRSVILALEGVVDYCHNFAHLAERMAATMKDGQEPERVNLLQIRDRMNRIADSKPETMIDAMQLLFTMHCCLSLTGEPCGIGRIDQMIYPFYEADLSAGVITEEHALEVLQAFWIKIGEKVQQNRMMVEDHQPMGNLAMGGISGPYPQGAANGQWVQQITVGGTVADDSPDGGTAYNTLTKLALRASRLPLNAPCLSLRVRKDIPDIYLEEAAKTLLTGGAHPIFLNDDKLIPGLLSSGSGVGGDAVHSTNWNSNVTLKSARNYACDGCYEAQFPGENWFTLGGFSALNPLECALNKGRLYVTAGPTYLLGQSNSFTSHDAKDIKNFDELLELYRKHFHWLITKAIDAQMGLYGAASSVCPAPLLSVLMDDCIAKGLDHYNGGTKYNIFGPCFYAVPSTINSLYAIKKMVFDPVTAVTSLPELVHCLLCDWGNKMEEPLFSSLAGGTRSSGLADRYRRLRDQALSYPRFGRGNDEVDYLGQELLKIIADETVGVFTNPISPMKEKMARFAEKYGSSEYPFGFQIQPGVGNFESYVDFGKFNGASADGRRSGGPIASDLSPAPSPGDRKPEPQYQGFLKSMKGYDGKGTDSISQGAPSDFNIDEEYPKEALVDALKAFAQGHGSNVMTVTCSSSVTFDEAQRNPETYDLLRVRMGGWSEFFTSMFPPNQEQHRRRPRNIQDT